MTVTAFIGVRGGAGASSLACRAAAQPDSLLVDFDLPAGDLDLRCAIPRVTASLADLLALDPAAIVADPGALDAVAYRYGQGCALIPSPASPELADVFSPDHVQAIVDTAAARSGNVVLDLGTGINVRTLTAASCADVVVLVCRDGAGASLRSAMAVEDVLRRAGVAAPRQVATRSRRSARALAARLGLEAHAPRRSVGATLRVPVWRLRDA